METKQTPSELPIKCQELAKDILGTGDFLSQPTAKQYITNYLGGLQDPTGKGHNFGYLFGLDNFQSFIDQVNDYNNNLGDDDLPIEGVRVFVCRVEPKVAAGVPRESIMDSVFLMPIRSDGTDLYQVQPLHDDDPGIILGDPRPCPNECLDSLSFYKKQK